MAGYVEKKRGQRAHFDISNNLPFWVVPRKGFIDWEPKKFLPKRAYFFHHERIQSSPRHAVCTSLLCFSGIVDRG